MPKARTVPRTDDSKIGLILGTGLYNLYSPRVVETFTVHTIYGDAELSRIPFKSDTKSAEIFVLLRHGAKHSLPPHLINYRANISAFNSQNVDCIIATSSVGAINSRIPVGSYVVIDQFIDQTTRRPNTVFGDVGERFAHTDMTHPYSEDLRKVLLSALRRNKVSKVFRRGTYVCTEGPRFETPAEISMYRKLGGDVVGMTGIPEVVLANELAMPYASLCFVTNMAAGMQRKISNEEVIVEMKKHESRIKTIIDSAVEELAG